MGIVVAGQGEADGGASDCIWPHEYYLTYAYRIVTTTVNGKTITIDQYACSNELATNKRYGKTANENIVYGTQINGIGTVCHEFSHCLGYPDMYDIAYKNYGMSNWDLMDGGSYNGKWNGGHNNWANINAVKNKEVYVSPQSPFKWFDRPVGANMIIGVPWTAKVIYPDDYKDIDMVSATKEFYSNFYHFDLSDNDAKQLLLDSGLKESNL